MNNSDTKKIKEITDSVIDLHIQKIPTKGDKLIQGRLDLKDLRERVTDGFRNSVCAELENRGFTSSYDNESKTVEFRAGGVENISLSLEQRKEAAEQLKTYNKYNPNAAEDILKG